MRTGSVEISPAQGAQIASIARELTSQAGRNYARDEAPVSPYQGLTGNSSPGQSRLTWLKGLYKCNQFLGDVLTLAGLRMPTYRMHDGSEHYVNAEALLNRPANFARLSQLERIQAGDLILIDWQEAGENGAHIEVIADIDLTSQKLLTYGAHKNGAEMMDFSWIFRGATFDPQRSAWVNRSPARGDYLIYALRPLLPGVGFS